MILVDSSGWIDYLAARPKAEDFAPYIEGDKPLMATARRHRADVVTGDANFEGLPGVTVIR